MNKLPDSLKQKLLDKIIKVINDMEYQYDANIVEFADSKMNLEPDYFEYIITLHLKPNKENFTKICVHSSTK